MRYIKSCNLQKPDGFCKRESKGVMMQKKPFLIGRTFIVFTIIASMTISQIWAQEKEKEKYEIYSKGMRDGEIAGEIESARGSGFTSGCCLGPFGCLLVPVPMEITEPPFKMLKDIEHKSEIYKTGFRDGFKEKKKNQFNEGVIFGTITFAVVSVGMILFYKNEIEGTILDPW